MTKLYLHIGTEKTGTTHIQQFILRNRNKLFSNGYYVPDFLGEFAHTWLPILVYEDNKEDDLTDKEKIYEQDNPNTFIKLSFARDLASPHMRFCIPPNSGGKVLVINKYIIY